MAERGARRDAAMRSDDRRALNRGFGDALSRAFELAVTPTIFGGFGWLLDRWLGTAPVLMLVLFLFTAVYLMWKLLTGYDAAMRAQEDELFRFPRESQP